MRGGQNKKTQGFATLLFTMVVLASITAFAFISAQSVVTNQRSVMVYHEKQSAFNTAQAGLDYAVSYLTANYASIAANGSIPKINMPGGSYALVSYTLVGDKNTLQVTSTGYSSDNLAATTVQQVLKYNSGSNTKTFAQPITSRLGMNISGTASVIAGNNASLVSAKLGTNTVNISSGAATKLNGVVISKPGSIGSDIIIDPSIFSGKTNQQLETAMLGQTIDQFATVPTAVYVSNSGSIIGSHIGSDPSRSVPVRGFKQTALAPYISSSPSSGSMKIISDIDVDIGYAGSAVTLGTPTKPVILEITLVKTHPSIVPMAKILLGTRIYGDVIVHGGNLEIDTAASVVGNVIVQSGTAKIKNYNGYYSASLGNVSGALLASGDVTISNGSVKGIVYTNGNLLLSPPSSGYSPLSMITGATYAGGGLTALNSPITYDSSLAKITGGASGGTSAYGKVAGSWKDS